MLCPARCDCFLCRELQACRAADARKPPNNKMCDNFILKKADAWESSGAMRFIRGAARLSVRHWQSRDPLAPAKTRLATNKSTSCEQLYPLPVATEPAPGMWRAPSVDRPVSERRPLFRLLGNVRLRKTNSSDNACLALDSRKSKIPDSKNVHEKYVPLNRAPPVLDRHYRDFESPVPSEKRYYADRPPCYEELARKLSKDRRSRADTPIEGELANKITQTNNKVVIYFGDSIIRKHEQKNEPDGEASRLVSQVEVPEVACSVIEQAPEPGRIDDATYKKNTLGTVSTDGFLVVEFEENFERARRLVDSVVGGTGGDRCEATVLDDDCDWSFIQDWRKRPSSGCRPLPVEQGAWCAAPALTAARATRVRIPPPCADGALPNAPSAAHSRRLDPPHHAHNAPLIAFAPFKGTGVEDTDAAPLEYNLVGPQLKNVSAPAQLTAQSTPVRSAPAQTSHGLQLQRRTSPDTAVARHRPPLDHVTILPDTDLGVSRLFCALDAPAPNAAPAAAGECGSSSDENRSSGHASMSDSGGAGEEPRRTRHQLQHARPKHRPHNSKLQSPWPGGGGLQDIRSAIQRLTLRSRDSSSTATSGASSGGGHYTTAGGGGAEARRRRAPLARQPSLDTVCTNVTSADEFVWVDSHNRLVELRCVPWSASEIERALAAGRCRDLAPRLAPDTSPRLALLLQRALVRVAREAQRLSHNFGFCSKHEVAGAFRIVLSARLADVCIKSCQRAATMSATSGSAARRLGSAARARTTLAPGRFQRWMLDVRVAPFIHEYAAIYLCAGMEALLEEVALVAFAGAGTDAALTPALLEHAVATCADLWGLLQPYSHLNAGRLASGALSLSRWESLNSLRSSSSGSSGEPRHLGLSHDSGITTNGSGGSGASEGSGSGAGSAQSVLLTTCAGSAAELRAVLRRAAPRQPPLTPAAERALYYFMRCSQLEHGSGATNSEGGSGATSSEGESGGDCALWSARGSGALPPLGEWVRVARAHAELRAPPHAPDADDVLQAARLLLPSADCPPRPLVLEEPIEPRWPRCGRPSEESSRAALGLAHRMLLSGRAELVSAARTLLPAAGLDAHDAAGLTALMKAAMLGDEQVVAMLLEAGADPNVETPANAAQHSALLSPRSPLSPAQHQSSSSPSYTPPTAGWTALVYACAASGAGASAMQVSARLLAAGARVDGAAARSDDVCTLTPLQVACGAGSVELVQLLLSHGADPFLCTQLTDALCYSPAAQYGCYSAVTVCCTHGRRGCLRALLASGSGARGHGEVLSLEEVLAEGAGGGARSPHAHTKAQQRALQDAMYYAAETDHLDMTLELRALGVPWSLHAWTRSLSAAADAALQPVVDQLLQDFLQVCPSEDSHCSQQFISECLPLLFNILRHTKREGTVMLVADILCACYGWESVPPVAEPPPAARAPVPPPPPRVDPTYVNNPSLADVTFRVEGRLFYGHKIVLVSESARLRAMLAPPRAPQPPHEAPAASQPGSATAAAAATATPPLVQINDIRYHIFEQVMRYLYSGGCAALQVAEADVLELLAAASFFQLLPLQRHCEARAARTVQLHNLVSVYIHAKVYGATQLLQYCQGFLLQNMVALLRHDDSVKRLLFGKRLPGHNVLAALLVTLQSRLEARRQHAKNR